jgi:hypothetical protein
MGQNNTPFVLNGYSYADCKATFNGVDLPGVTSFELNAPQNKANNYGLGQNPISRSRGNKEFSGSMEMDYDTQNLLAGLSPTGLLTDIPSGVLVFSLEKDDGGKEIITMPFFEFSGDGLSGSQGDENLTHSIDVIFGGYFKESF